MRRYLAAASLLLVCGALAVLLTPKLRGQTPGQDHAADPRPPTGQHAPRTDQAEVLNELIQLRDEIGGGVLQGSLLETSPAQSRREFARGLEQAVQLPPPEAATPGPEVVGPSEAATTVGVIRENCRRLDRLAAQLEDLRQYEVADQLREVAHELRLSARQLDPRTAAE